MLRISGLRSAGSLAYIHTLRRVLKHQTISRLKPLVPPLHIAPTEIDAASYQNRVLYVKNLPFHFNNDDFLEMYPGLQSVQERGLSYHKTSYRVLKFSSVAGANNAWAWLQANRLYIHNHAVQILSDHVVSFMLDSASQEKSPYMVRRKLRGKTKYVPLLPTLPEKSCMLYLRISGVENLVENFIKGFRKKLSDQTSITVTEKNLLKRRIGTDLDIQFDDLEELARVEEKLLTQLMKTSDEHEIHRDDLSVYVSRRKFNEKMWVKLDRRISSHSLKMKLVGFAKRLPREQGFHLEQADDVYTNIMDNKGVFMFDSEDNAEKFYSQRNHMRLCDKKVYSYRRNDAGFSQYNVPVERTIYFAPSGRHRLAESIAYKYIPGLSWYDRQKRTLLFSTLIHANYFYNYYDKLLPIRWASCGTPEWTVYKSPHRAKTLDRGQRMVVSEEKLTKSKPDPKSELHDAGAQFDFG